MAQALDKDALAKLSVSERLRLIELIWSTLEAESEPALTPSQQAEVDRRIEHWRSNPDSAITHSEFQARIRKLM
jgi:putative addiction module component (TIGR02574 family)